MIRTAVSLMLAACCAAILAAYWPIVLSIHRRWDITQGYSHGYLVLLISAYLVFRLLPSLRATPFKPSGRALWLLAATAFVGFFGYAAQVQVLQQLVIPALMWLCVTATLGWQAGRLLAFPFALLYFAIPLWDFLTDPLRMATVFVAQHVLHVLDIPAIINRFFIEMPAGIIEVAGGCSGLNYLLTGLVVGVLHAYLSVAGRWRRVAVVAIAVVLSIISNWVRVTTLVLLGHYTHMQSHLIYHHGPFGWWLFAGAMVIFFLLSRLVDGGGMPPLRVTGPLPAIIPVRRMAIICAAATLLAVAFPAWAYWQGWKAGQAQSSDVLPAPAAAFSATPTWRPDYEGYDLQQSWVVQWQGRPYDVLALTYFTQHAGKKLIYYKNRIAAPEATPVDLRGIAVNGQRKVNQAVVHTGRGTRAVWWFYLIGQHTAADNYTGKLLQFVAAVRGHPRASLIAISTPCRQSDCGAVLREPAPSYALVEQIMGGFTGPARP